MTLRIENCVNFVLCFDTGLIFFLFFFIRKRQKGYLKPGWNIIEGGNFSDPLLHYLLVAFQLSLTKRLAWFINEKSFILIILYFRLLQLLTSINFFQVLSKTNPSFFFSKSL